MNSTIPENSYWILSLCIINKVSTYYFVEVEIKTVKYPEFTFN